MELDAVLLSRIQFAVNITFHILFPSITIALAWILLFFKLRYNKTQDYKWMEAYFFWTKIFALTFAMGVVSGITMSFQFGTNWSVFMEKVGNIAGPLLGYEVLTAFFLEATFLGVMLFGFRRVSQKLHTTATVLVAVGTTLSAFWILALNSWMQTPDGFKMIDGVAHATDWWAIVMNPSFPYRLVHMLIASGLTALFFVAGVSAYRWLRKDRAPAVLSALRVGVIGAAFLIPIQFLVGDLHGLNTLEHQPQKIAAMEGLWQTKKGAPFVVIGIPDKEKRKNMYAIELPNMASIVLTHDREGVVKGINEFAGNHPPVLPVFFAFRAMLAVGGLMLIFSVWGAIRLWRKKTPSPLLAKGLVLMTFSGWIGVVAGWYVSEVGRQPWLVTGILRTKDSVSDIVAPAVSVSLLLYSVVYSILLVAYVTTVFYMAKKAVRSRDHKIAVGSGQAIVETIAK